MVRAAVQAPGLKAPAGSTGVIAAAAVSDAVQAAQRDTAFERLARQRLQAELAALQEQLKQARTKLRLAHDELKGAQAADAAARSAELQLAACGERLEASRAEVAELQEQLRGARADCARKAALLKAAQVRRDTASFLPWTARCNDGMADLQLSGRRKRCCDVSCSQY